MDPSSSSITKITSEALSSRTETSRFWFSGIGTPSLWQVRAISPTDRALLVDLRESTFSSKMLSSLRMADSSLASL
eukprot:766665-Hanusia_phi.AAC.6